ncbi:hypothetical protein ACOTTU_24120 [Roseobacter sp. EG26]|uniref:hypothetical protein n=1 Tax=Roseobacter sp. EG26 TaxID=3412477 RepID=UPI003CE46929
MRQHLAWVNLIPLTIVVLMHFAKPVQAQELGTWRSGEALALPFETITVDGEFAVEIGAYDVTDFVIRLNGELAVSRDVFVPNGLQEVNVYVLQNDQYTLVASYDVLVSRDAPRNSPVLHVEVGAEHLAGVTTVNGDAASLATSYGSAALNNDSETLTGRIDYLASTNSEDQINDNEIDIAEYFLEYQHRGTHAGFTGRLGHQSLEYDPVLVGDLYRRGVAFQTTLLNERFTIGAFAARASEVLGSEDIFGLNDPSDRITGTQLSLNPFSGRDLAFSFQHYAGQGVPFGGDVPGKGSGWSTSLNGTELDGRIRYGAAFGQTDWDEDGAENSFETEKGAATFGYLSYDLLHSDDAEKQLTVGLEYEAIEQDYFSLANPNLFAGAETLRFTANYSTERLALNFTAEEQETKFGGSAIFPTDKISSLAIDGTFQLASNGYWQDASLQFGARSVRQTRLATPLLAPEPENFVEKEIFVGLEKYSETGSWFIEYSVMDFNDQSVFDTDETSQIATFGFDRQLGDQLTLSGLASLTAANADQENSLRKEVSLDARYEIVPDKWAVSLAGGIARTDQSFDDDGSFIAAELVWKFSPSAELLLTGTRNTGSFSGDSGQGNETIIGLFIRINTSFLK